MVLSAPLFAEMDTENSRALIDSMNPVAFARGDVLFHEGDPGDRLLLVEVHRTRR